MIDCNICKHKEDCCIECKHGELFERGNVSEPKKISVSICNKTEILYYVRSEIRLE